MFDQTLLTRSDVDIRTIARGISAARVRAIGLEKVDRLILGHDPKLCGKRAIAETQETRVTDALT